MLKCIFTILFCFLFHPIFCQKWSDNMEIEANYGVGYVLPEYQILNLITNDYTRSFEFSLRKNTYGKTDWERLYKYPSYGVRFIYSTLGNSEILGELWGIYPYFQLTIANFNRLQIVNQTGLGYSRVNRKYDEENNYLNVAIGSYGNLHFNSRLLLSYNFGNRLKLSTALSFDHFSNANTAEPNLGINYLSWTNGLSYSIGKQNEKQNGELFEKQNKAIQELVLSLGAKHSRALTSEYYNTLSLSYEIRKAYFRALHLGLGADFFYDSSVEDQMAKNEQYFQPIDQYQTGIHISQTFVYNKFSLTLQEGLYIWLKEKVDDYVMYNRGIIKYRATEHFSVRFTMKSHLHILDYPEIGFGWVL